MDKRAAAEYLGVSVRTIERWASSGRLKRGRAPGRRRARSDFDIQDLDVIKARMSGATEAGTEAPPREKPRDTISFRIDPEYLRRLEREGRTRNLSAPEYARSLIVLGLDDDRVNTLSADIQSLRRGLAEMFSLILTEKFGASEADAMRIVSNMLRRQ